MELFCAAAAEIGLTLPDIGARELWLARHADRIEPRIPDETLHRRPMERFNDGLRVLPANREAARPLDQSMAQFLEHLGLFIDHRVDQYEPWLQALEASMSQLGTDTPAELARSVSALIRSISHGPLEASDLAAVTELRDRSERL